MIDYLIKIDTSKKDYLLAKLLIYKKKENLTLKNILEFFGVLFLNIANI